MTSKKTGGLQGRRGCVQLRNVAGHGGAVVTALGKVAGLVLAHMRDIDPQEFHPGTKRDETAADQLVSAGLAAVEVRTVTIKFNGGSMDKAYRYYRLTDGAR